MKKWQLKLTQKVTNLYKNESQHRDFFFAMMAGDSNAGGSLSEIKLLRRWRNGYYE